jgi:nicotinamidase-related amidase
MVYRNVFTNCDGDCMKALLCLDFQNDIVHPAGKVSGKGYAVYNEQYGVTAKVKQVQQLFRENQWPVIHVRVGFSADYREQPKNSPLMGRAHEFGAFLLGGWGTEFLSPVAPLDTETVITKHRVSAFYATELELLLRTKAVRDIYLCGVATDMVVESTARDAHDRDFSVFVVEDACIAAKHEDHINSLAAMKKLATILAAAEIAL